MAGRPALAALLAVVLATTASATRFDHPDFASGLRRPRHVVVLPAQSQIIRARMVDAAPLVKETASLESGVEEGLADAIDGLGYDGDAQALDVTVVNADRDLQQLVVDLQDRVDDVLGNVTNRPRDVRDGRYTIGESVLPLAARVNADAFLVVRAQAIVPSKGQRTLSAVFGALVGGVPIPPTNVTRGIVVLIDGRTGDVAWLSAAQVSGAVIKEPEAVGRKLGGALAKSYPRAGEVRKSKPGRARDAGSAPDEPDDDAESVIAEFERTAAEGAAPAAAIAPGPAESEAAPTDVPAEPPPLPTEDVPQRAEGVEASAARAVQATEADLPAASAPPESPPAMARPVEPPADETAPAAVSASPAEIAAVVPPPTALSDPRAMWDVPAAGRATPTRQLVFQMLEGGPGVVVRNMSEPAVWMSVDLEPFFRLDAAERRSLERRAGSHRFLVASADGVEIARGSCIVAASALALAEVWPTQ